MSDHSIEILHFPLGRQGGVIHGVNTEKDDRKPSDLVINFTGPRAKWLGEQLDPILTAELDADARQLNPDWRISGRKIGELSAIPDDQLVQYRYRIHLANMANSPDAPVVNVRDLEITASDVLSHFSRLQKLYGMEEAVARCREQSGFSITPAEEMEGTKVTIAAMTMPVAGEWVEKIISGIGLSSGKSAA